jgi:hypothetical protein
LLEIPFEQEISGIPHQSQNDKDMQPDNDAHDESTCLLELPSFGQPPTKPGTHVTIGAPLNGLPCVQGSGRCRDGQTLEP